LAWAGLSSRESRPQRYRGCGNAGRFAKAGCHFPSTQYASGVIEIKVHQGSGTRLTFPDFSHHNGVPFADFTGELEEFLPILHPFDDHGDDTDAIVLPHEFEEIKRTENRAIADTHSLVLAYTEREGIFGKPLRDRVASGNDA
jgi:hypothetical protein